MSIFPEWFLPFFQWCEATSIGSLIRNSIWLFPVVEAVHLLALATLGGAILVVDLHLLGFALHRQPRAQLARDVFPWVIGGLAAMLASGIILFLSEALKSYENLPFQLKMVFLLAALIFTFTIRQRVVMAEERQIKPFLAKATAIASMTLWSSVGLMGRYIGSTKSGKNSGTGWAGPSVSGSPWCSPPL